MKNLITLLFLFSTLLVVNSCNNSTEVENIITETPVVTGLFLTSEESDVRKIWRNPQWQEHINYCNENNTDGIPCWMDLHHPYPNPSNGSIIITFSLPVETKVSLWLEKARLPEDKESNLETSSGGVFLIARNKSKIKLLNELKKAGIYRFVWNAKTENNEDAPSGFYRVYFKADGRLFWRDILLRRKCSELPPDLRSRCRD